MPFPYGPADGREGLAANVRTVAAHRQAVGPDFPLMIDCFMSLDLPYALEFAQAVEPYGLYWIEEALHPDDWEGYRQLKAAAPWVRWVTGEHEYTRWGFRDLIRHRAVDIVQPDLMWAGGFTEATPDRLARFRLRRDCRTACRRHLQLSLRHDPTRHPLRRVLHHQPQRATRSRRCSETCSMANRWPLDGTITLSDAPGWGLELRRDAIQLKRFAA